MSDVPIASHNYCIVPGCTDPATKERMIVTGPETERRVEVCWKHEESDLDITSLELGDWGE